MFIHIAEPLGPAVQEELAVGVTIGTRSGKLLRLRNVTCAFFRNVHKHMDLTSTFIDLYHVANTFSVIILLVVTNQIQENMAFSIIIEALTRQG